MKKELEHHIQAIFDSLGITTSFSIYENEVDNLPEWCNNITITHQFIICCPMLDDKKHLQKFIGKEIKQYDNITYWFDGDLITINPKAIITDNAESKMQSKTTIRESLPFKDSTHLPSWLDDFIFSTLHANYSPDHELFANNLDSSEEKNRQYLGTYFPRSYAESFCLFNILFKFKEYFKILLTKESFSILSIGCGTGGDLLGLLTVIDKYLPHITSLKIITIDGNADSLLVLKKIIDKYNTITGKRISFTSLKTIFRDFDVLDKSVINSSFDFILSFKMIGEIISEGKGSNNDAYYHFTKKFLPLLSDIGICGIIDVTTKSPYSTFNPILLNQQINKALLELADYQTILPISCSRYERDCTTSCFFQKAFCVSHSRCNNDKSKIAYRIIASKSMASLLIKDDEHVKGLISNELFCAIAESEKTDIVSKNNQAPPPLPVAQDNRLNDNINAIKQLHLNIPDEKQSQSVSETIEDRFYKGGFVIDTNVFIECPDIISRIDVDYFIILSAKVLEELDYLKVKKNLSRSRKKRVVRALCNLNSSFESHDIELADSDLALLPKDFDKHNPDNRILSVALHNIQFDPVLLTSDNTLQIRAKGLGIKTISLKDYLKNINTL